MSIGTTCPSFPFSGLSLWSLYLYKGKWFHVTFIHKSYSRQFSSVYFLSSLATVNLNLRIRELKNYDEVHDDDVC